MLFQELTLIDDREPHPAALNMALDEVLLGGAKEVLLRYYRWARPAVSFGYFGDAEEVQRNWPGRDLVRRWTGGGTVPHGDDFTYSLIVPRGADVGAMSAAESYRRVHEAVARACAGAAVLSREAAARVSSACFENPAVSDVMIDGRKAAGAAQRRTARGLLHQGSVQGQDAGLGERLVRELARMTRRRAFTCGEMIAGRALAERKYAMQAWTERFSHPCRDAADLTPESPGFTRG